MMIGVLIGGASAVSLALPLMGQDLNISPATAVWVLHSYQIMIIATILPCSALAERFGHRRVFRLGLVALCVGAGLVVLMPEFVPLMIGRLCQGLGAAMVMSVSPALLRDIYPAARLGLAVSINAFAIAIAGAVGPILGSLVLKFAHWPALFGMIMPLGILSLALSHTLPEDEKFHGSFDFRGALLNALAIGGIITGMSLVEQSCKTALVVLALSCLSFFQLLWHLRKVTNPVLPLDLLQDRRLAFAYSASLLNFAINSINMVALPFFLIRVLAVATVYAGEVLALWAASVATAAIAAGWLSDRFWPERLCLVGSSTSAIGLIGIVLSVHVGGLPLAAIGTCGAGLGFGLFQSPNNRILISAAPRNRRAVAGGLQAMSREVGNGLGFGFAGLCFTVLQAPGATLALVVAFCLAVVSIVLNLVRPFDLRAN